MKKKLCIALAMIMTVGVVLSGCGVGAKNGETAGSDNKAEQGKQEGKRHRWFMEHLPHQQEHLILLFHIWEVMGS